MDEGEKSSEECGKKWLQIVGSDASGCEGGS